MKINIEAIYKHQEQVQTVLLDLLMAFLQINWKTQIEKCIVIAITLKEYGVLEDIPKENTSKGYFKQADTTYTKNTKDRG